MGIISLLTLCCYGPPKYAICLNAAIEAADGGNGLHFARKDLRHQYAKYALKEALHSFEIHLFTRFRTHHQVADAMLHVLTCVPVLIAASREMIKLDGRDLGYVADMIWVSSLLIYWLGINRSAKVWPKLTADWLWPFHAWVNVWTLFVISVMAAVLACLRYHYFYLPHAAELKRHWLEFFFLVYSIMNLFNAIFGLQKTTLELAVRLQMRLETYWIAFRLAAIVVPPEGAEDQGYCEEDFFIGSDTPPEREEAEAPNVQVEVVNELAEVVAVAAGAEAAGIEAELAAVVVVAAQPEAAVDGEAGAGAEVAEADAAPRAEGEEPDAANEVEEEEEEEEVAEGEEEEVAEEEVEEEEEDDQDIDEVEARVRALSPPPTDNQLPGGRRRRQLHIETQPAMLRPRGAPAHPGLLPPFPPRRLRPDGRSEFAFFLTFGEYIYWRERQWSETEHPRMMRRVVRDLNEAQRELDELDRLELENRHNWGQLA